MKVRITEKLAKNRRVTMLKHSPCTVVGWLLHPEDRETTPESQRLLKHLPLCIYIKFEGAKWKVHPDMEPGVFPLKPVERQWTINEKTKAQAKRKGYALLPDFACTSHMIQGETLEAELAECGNVFDTPPLKDMLSAYVMLSRVKRATGLLLLRAFSLYLFRHGPPPGPHCLMKLLRSRLTPTESQGIYTQSDAKAEFDSLQARRREERDQRKQAGLLWHCFDCQKEYPPEVYCGRTNNKERMFQDCVAHGHWRTCSACQLAHTRTQKDATYSDAVRSCTKCAVFKTEHYFEEESESCMACDLEEKYIVIRCSKCSKFKYKADCSEGWIEDGHAELICTQCCPDKDKLTCFICEKNGPSHTSHARIIKNRNASGARRVTNAVYVDSRRQPVIWNRGFDHVVVSTVGEKQPYSDVMYKLANKSSRRITLTSKFSRMRRSMVGCEFARHVQAMATVRWMSYLTNAKATTNIMQDI